MANRAKPSKRLAELPAFPMLQMFAGLIGVLLIIVVLSAMRVKQIQLEQTNPENLVGIQNIDLSSKPQLKFALYKDHVLIQATQQKIPLALLVRPNNPVSQYLRPHIRAVNARQKDVFLYLYPDANRTMYLMRQLLSNMHAQYFNLLLLNEELIEQLTDEEGEKPL